MKMKTVKEASVVLLTDDALKSEEENWPVSYEFHADVLSKILYHRPKGVVVDFGFIDQRDYFDIEPLFDIIDLYCEEEVPILFAGANSLPQVPLGVRADLAARAEIVSLVDPGPLRESLRYPLWDLERSLVDSEKIAFLPTDSGLCDLQVRPRKPRRVAQMCFERELKGDTIKKVFSGATPWLLRSANNGFFGLHRICRTIRCLSGLIAVGSRMSLRSGIHRGTRASRSRSGIVLQIPRTEN